MKKMLFVLLAGLAFSWVASADSTVLKGIDEQGKACSLEVLDVPPTDDYAWGRVRVSYSGSVLFELSPFYGANGSVDRERLHGARTLVTASTQVEYVVIYFPSQKLVTYSETRLNARSGDIFLEVYRECRLGR